MNRTLLALASLSFVLSVSSIACSSDDDDGDDDSTSSSSSSGGSSGGSSGAATSSSSSSGAATSSSSSSGAAASSSSGGVAALNGCSTYVDHTGDTEVTIEWQNPLNDANKCSKVKVGTKVIWDGDTGPHPLNSKGGDTPTPILLKNTAGEGAEVTFTTAGTFGYVCTNHSNMTGAIQVVE